MQRSSTRLSQSRNMGSNPIIATILFRKKYSMNIVLVIMFIFQSMAFLFLVIGIASKEITAFETAIIPTFLVLALLFGTLIYYFAALYPIGAAL